MLTHSNVTSKRGLTVLLINGHNEISLGCLQERLNLMILILSGLKKHVEYDIQVVPILID
jgi:hypothetical protein